MLIRIIHENASESWGLLTSYEDEGYTMKEIEIEFSIRYLVDTYTLSIEKTYAIRSIDGDHLLYQGGIIDTNILYGFSDELIKEDHAKGRISGIKKMNILHYHICRAYLIYGK